MKDKHGQRAYDLIPAGDNDCRGFIREAEAQASQLDDVANGNCDSDLLDIADRFRLRRRCSLGRRRLGLIVL